ncbi:carbohydrate ABC transporter permease [Cohnella zeiphila]|uniref:Carbohydrate ABC transporter permease n=1 Tax=Cohnella zeiphila TaxID=2761120 RepID=A0A7X0VUE7_9BACL|nr:carbohydrate ABC transporter permease [Cohnella zeiphila]MBB6730866.1 carbohydrate ABC transporter permease [Cohnella zeiphila]
MGSGFNKQTSASRPRKSGWLRRNKEDYFIDTFVYLFCTIVLIITLYPFYYCLVISFNEGKDAALGGILLWPRKFTLENYKIVFENKQLMQAFGITIARTVIGTVLSVAACALFAYGLALKDLLFKKVYISILVFAMFFSGGIIPYFLLLQYLHLMNTFWVYIIPNLIGAFTVILMMSFFRELPQELKEAAKIDGASEFRIFYQIMMPLSKPVLAAVALFVGVGHWNSWFDSAYFVFDRDLRTASHLLMELINKANMTSMAAGMDQREVLESEKNFTSETIRMATMIVIVTPIVCVYPFLQKYFVKGMMIGSIKG